MADSDKSNAGFWSRFSRFSTRGSEPLGVSTIAEPIASTNGNGHTNGNGNGKKLPALIAGKASPESLLPQLNGADVADFSDFIPLDNAGNTIPTRAIGSAALAFAAYWYVAERWRAQKIAEAPLMVVAEDQQDGTEEWLSDHELAGVLDEPSPDFDMGDLLERTSRYLDAGGECLWVIDRDRADRVGRITPFRRSEFEVAASNGRIFGTFRVRTANGQETKTPEEVCYFRDSTNGSDGWGRCRSRLDVAMSWLGLAETARATIRDLLENSVWPSLIAIPDKEWNPNDEDFKRYKAELNAYSAEKGKAFAMLGGGTVVQLVARIRDLVPEELLNRVESIVAAVSGVPAVVLQFQVGMENSPWSQMAQARRMAYDDTIQPAWRKIERVLTRQLLRIDDDDPTHFIRFDRTKIASLQRDQLESAQIATMMGRAATLNERRAVMGLEPSTEPGADAIPELAPPPVPPTADPNAANDPTQQDTQNGAAKMEQKRAIAGVARAFRLEARSHWETNAALLLRHDAAEIERVIREHAPKAGPGYAVKAAPDFLSRVMTGVIAYLRVSQRKWATVVEQLFSQGAERSLAVASADLGLSYQSLHPRVVTYAKQHAAELVSDIADTTRQTVKRVIERGLADEKTVEEIAREVAESGAFTPSRAKLIAQTESTRASEGAPVLALQAYARSTGRHFVKRWSGELDERERDAHVKLEGETRPIDAAFSNGLQFPGDPAGDPAETCNCRCSLILTEVVDE